MFVLASNKRRELREEFVGRQDFCNGEAVNLGNDFVVESYGEVAIFGVVENSPTFRRGAKQTNNRR